MAKPTVNYNWATDPSANITIPDTATKDNGWAYDQIPPSGWQNYQMNAVMQWLDWLVAEVDGLRTPVESGRCRLKSSNASYIAFLSWWKYGDGEVRLKLEDYLRIDTTNPAGEAYSYGLIDEVSDTAIPIPWGGSSNYIITTIKRDFSSPLTITTPYILTFKNIAGGYGIFYPKEMTTVDISGTSYEVYRDALTIEPSANAEHIPPFTAVI